MYVYFFSLTLLVSISSFAGWPGFASTTDFFPVHKESRKKVGNVVEESNKEYKFDRFCEIEHGIRKGERGENVHVILEDPKRKTSITYVIPCALLEQQIKAARSENWGNLREPIFRSRL